MGTDSRLYRDVAGTPNGGGCMLAIILGALAWFLLALTIRETINATKQEREVPADTVEDSRGTTPPDAEVRILLEDSSGLPYRDCT